MKYASLATAPSPQSEPLDDRQVKNNAGGFVYAIDDWARLDRFLILGSDAPTYYQTARALTKASAACVERCFAADPARTVARIVEISAAGRAPRNDPAIFALAIGAASSLETVRQASLVALPLVCRTGTHLFQFVAAAKALGRGWGRTMKRAVARWYDERPVGSLAFQVIKYREREGFSHNRLMQTAHPAVDSSPDRTALYRWICEKEGAADAADLPAIVKAFLAAKTAGKDKLLDLIREYHLPWEALPTEANTRPEVWQAMVPHLGPTALIRNLGNMSRIGAIPPMSKTEEIIVAVLGDSEALSRARVHPFAILQAMAVYSSGHGVRGSGTWEVSRPIVDALDGAFYKAFANVVPTGKRHLLALDVSGSMASSMIGGVLSAREASAAMALVTMAMEPATHVVGFTSGGRYSSGWGGSAISPLSISPSQRLTDAVRAISDIPFGDTDCALPMLYAIERKIEADVFVIYTDNETWAGSVHPMEALRRYRKKTGIDAKLIVVGMTSTGFSIADPADGGAMDVVGFDAAAPAVMADFVR